MEFLLKENLKLSSAPIPTVNFSGVWENDLKSIMDISVKTNGQISGKYKTAVGQPSNIEEFEISGIATGDLISFIVNFGKYGSLTAWVGQHTKEEGKEVIKTMWHLAKNFKDEDEEDKIWSAVWTGANNFYRKS